MRFIGFIPAVIVSFSFLACVNKDHEEQQPHWGYDGGSGPPAWGELCARYRGCSSGKHQSPVDIDVASVHAAKLPELGFHYGPTPGTEENNGHTIQDTLAPGDFVTFGDLRFELEQFHFHHPSEHTLNGVHFPMEIHMVHRGPSGQLLVIGVFVKEGKEHQVLRGLFDHLPNDHHSVKLSADPARLLPSDSRFVEYEGSLTTPPCTEGVTWLVMTTPIAASTEQIDTFARLFPHNNRPLRPLNGRRLLSSGGR